MLYQAFRLSQKLEQPLFWVDERVFSTVVDWRTSAPKNGMPAENTYSVEAMRTLDTHRTPIQKQPEMLLCLVGISHRYYMGDEVYPTFLHNNDRDMDLFSLIRAPNPTKVKTGSRPRAAHEVPLLTVTANRVIDMEGPAAATDSSGVPSTIERSPLDFANKAGDSDQGTTAPEVMPSEDVPTTIGAPEAGQAKEVTATDPSAVTESRKRGHDGVDANAPPKVLRRDHVDPPANREYPAPADVSNPDPLSFADPQSRHPPDVAQSSQGTAAAGDPESENASFTSAVGSPKSIYRPEWGVANGSMLDTPEACQDLVDHVAPPGAMGSQQRLRFEQEAKLLKKSVAQVARRDKRIQAREQEIKNLEALLEAEADMKKAAKEKVTTLQEQVSEEEKLKASFEEFKQWMIGRGLRLAVMKCGESLELWQAFADVVSAGITKGMSEVFRHGVEHGHAQLSLESIEAYDPEAKAKYIVALQALKDLNSSQLTIPMYPEVHDPMNPWAYKEEMLLADAIATNVSRAEKKKKCRIVCRTHGVGSAHHAWSDGVPVSVPIVVPQGLVILLADMATQTKPDEATLDNL
uniref:Transposase (Putative), gypsy type n=1 Tax=Tanacetum cinerariifolium TaxID=118510 RepID=A0A6L2M8R6_TANCI|nr:transposase (putative), gypsy type [Tanacetum cinerariifolium]